MAGYEEPYFHREGAKTRREQRTNCETREQDNRITATTQRGNAPLLETAGPAVGPALPAETAGSSVLSGFPQLTNLFAVSAS